jgi:hypothetical protein
MARSFLRPAFNSDIEMFELVVPELFEHRGEEGQGGMGRGCGIGTGRGDCGFGGGAEEGFECAELAMGRVVSSTRPPAQARARERDRVYVDVAHSS